MILSFQNPNEFNPILMRLRRPLTNVDPIFASATAHFGGLGGSGGPDR
jgi:hypothetical protein